MSIGHLYVCFGEVSIQILWTFFNWIVCLSVLSCINPLYNLEINPLKDVSLVNMFSHIVGFLFILLMVSSAVKKLLSVIVVLFVIFFLYFHCPRNHIGKNIALRDV